VASVAKASVGYQAPIAGKNIGRTNVLFYGMTEDGLRTDSIILVSYYWQQKKIVTLNIPRDLYIYDGYENVKMGEMYAYAKNRQPKNSAYPDNFLASAIAKEYNIPINYWVQFNMQGEVDLINSVGGVDINVPDSFTDYQYPTWNYSGYIRPAPHFIAGPTHMNGATALIFSRSRHSLDNNEGTDFARSRRQMLVIQALMTKMKSMGIVGNISQVSNYLDILGNNLTSSMSLDEMVSFARTVKGLKPGTDIIAGNWATGNGFLCDSGTVNFICGGGGGGAYVTLYGSTSGSRGIGAGGVHNSNARQLALYYVQHLLTSAPMTPTDYVKSASEALWPTTESPSTSTSGTTSPGTSSSVYSNSYTSPAGTSQ
jgi:LCP family protein required for cell wall assembly